MATLSMTHVLARTRFGEVTGPFCKAVAAWRVVGRCLQEGFVKFRVRFENEDWIFGFAVF